MDERVSRLEQQFASIDAKLSKLDTIESQLGLMAKAVDVAEIKGQLSQMPKASEFAQLRAEVSRVAERTASLPTSWQMIIAFLGVILAILWKTK
jgi:hypothetical protein